ncbi:MAG: hypothetical protein ABEK50_00730 [bacterium]
MEMIVTLAVTSVLLLSLATVYSIMAEGMIATTSRSGAIEELNVAASQITSDLRAISRTPSRSDTTVLALQAKNLDGGFRNQGDTPHQELDDSGADYDPSEDADRLHVHSYYSDDQITIDRMASERVYFAYWINGETSNKHYSGMENKYSLLKRRAIHSRSDLYAKQGLVPYMVDYAEETEDNDTVPTPLLDLNQRNTNHKGIEILGVNVDHLSFRFYDPVNDTWQQCWDNLSTMDICDHTGDDNGKLPSVIQFAIRAYDERANNDSISSEEIMDPVWYQTAVKIKWRNL